MSFLETQDGSRGALGVYFQIIMDCSGQCKREKWLCKLDSDTEQLCVLFVMPITGNLSSNSQLVSLPSLFSGWPGTLAAKAILGCMNEAQMPHLCFTFHFCGSCSSSLNTAPCDSLSTWLYPDLWCQIHIVISQVLLGSHLANNNKNWKHTSTLPTSSPAFLTWVVDIFWLSQLLSA